MLSWTSFVVMDLFGCGEFMTLLCCRGLNVCHVMNS
jgi:hypothetical protein